VLGNHDHLPEWTCALDELAGREPRFRWSPFHLRLGNAVFQHGDVSTPGIDPARLPQSRARFAQSRPPSRALERAYDGVVALRLHLLGARLAFPQRAVLRRLSRYLDGVRHEVGDGVRNVYFGHTHIPVDGVEYGGRRFHNGGAAIDGVPFRVLRAELV
jgi:UDP-2,3-diacylglucosamine hydrolase